MENAVFTTLCMVYDDNDRILVQRRRGTSWTVLRSLAATSKGANPL